MVVPLEDGTDRAWRGPGRPWWYEEAVVAVGAVVVTLLIAAIVLQAWNWSLGNPERLDSDSLFNAMVIKNVLHHGWYLTNPNLGAPFGQQLYDFPLEGGNLPLLLIKGLGLFSSNAFVVTNLYFIATFVLVTLSAYAVLRCLRVSRVTSAGVSILYSLLPYHFFRGESHLFLSGYFAIPLAVLLVVWAVGDPPLVWRAESLHSTRIRLQFNRRRSLAALGCCIVLGSTDSYYAVFAIVALVGCGFLVALGRRAWRSLAICAALSVVILVVLAINLAPSLVYQLIHGTDPMATLRFPYQSELFGLKIARLFLPVAGHRIGAFGNFTASYDKFPLSGEASEALGLIFAVGLIVVLARGLAGRWHFGSDTTWRERTLNALALVAVVAIVVGAMTGLAGIFALITPQIRAWSRISVLIAFCAAAGLGLLLDQLFGRLRTRGWPSGTALVVMVSLVIIGSLDQTTAQDVPQYQTVSARMNTTRSFVQAVQDRLPEQAMVFQLPYEAFPESGGVSHMPDYEEAQGYLFSDTLRWSYGGIRGRPEDFAAPLSQQPVPFMVRQVAVAGFSAVYVDRTGYDDNGARVDSELMALLGPPIVASSDRALELYDLRPLASQLRAQFQPSQLASMSDAVLHQARIDYGSGFYGEESNGPGYTWRWASGRAQLRLTNLDARPKTVRFEATIHTPGSSPSQVMITGSAANEVDETLTTTSGGKLVSIDIRVPPGSSVVTLTTNAPRAPGAPGDTRDLHLDLVNPQFVDPVLVPLQG